MDKKYKVSDKLNGKWHSYGNVTPGEKGPRLGLRVSPELRELLANKKDGEWLNFLLFESDGEKPATGRASAPATTMMDDDSDIPF